MICIYVVAENDINCADWLKMGDIPVCNTNHLREKTGVMFTYYLKFGDRMVKQMIAWPPCYLRPNA